MFNGNTRQDFAALDELLDLADYRMHACGFIHEAALAYYAHYRATFGDALEGEDDNLLHSIGALLTALHGYHRDIAKIHRSVARDMERERKLVHYAKAVIPAELRWVVWERDNFTCRACGTRQDLRVDHSYPERLGGTLDLNNLQTLCRPCNSRKGAR